MDCTVQELISKGDVAALRSCVDLLLKAIKPQEDPYKKKTIPATNLTIPAVTDILGINYESNNAAYLFDLKMDGSGKQLSDWCTIAIEKIKKSLHHQVFHGEPLSRTVIDLIICDRLLCLDDGGSNRLLQVATEVDIRTEIRKDRKAEYDAGYVSGRADYTLGHGNVKTGLEAVLVIVEVKREGACSLALPQTLCYLAGIQDARKKAGKINLDVFGMMADANEFRFVFLDHSRKAFVSETLTWITKSGQIIAFLDHILQSAISSSPHTTPTKTNNQRIRNYDQHLEGTYKMGSGSNKSIKLLDGAAGYDIIQEDGKSKLVPTVEARNTNL